MDKYVPTPTDRGHALERDLPLHRQISEDLRKQIELEELRPGDLLPSEHQLAQRFGVARGTVRQAVATLRAEGLVTGSQGRQLVVRTTHLTQPFGQLVSFSDWVKALGKVPSSKVIEFGPSTAIVEMAATLRVAPLSTVYHLVRVRCADDEPLMVEHTTFPQWLGEMLIPLDLGAQSIYAELHRRGIIFASARHLIGAVPASHQDASLLGVPPRTPILRVRRQAYAPSGEPLECSDDHYLADRVNFAIENSAMMPGVARQLENSGD